MVPPRQSGLNSQLYPRSKFGRVPDAMRLGVEVARFGLEDVGHPGLRVPVVERKPAALDLNHDPVSPLEGVALLMQIHGELQWGVWSQRLRGAEAPAIAAAHDLVGDHELVSAPGPVVRDAVGKDIDQLHHPIGVAPGGRGYDAGFDVSGDRQVFLERGRYPLHDIGPAVYKTLVFRFPELPAAAPRVVGALHRPGAI